MPRQPQPTRPGKYGMPCEYGGRLWWPMPAGHYRNSRSKMLHRQVWEDNFGPIPHKWVIHHVDHNPANNKPDNLQLLTPSEHRVHHPRPSGRTSDEIKAMWRKRVPVAIECATCGTVFDSTGARATYCSRTCNRRAYNNGRSAFDERARIQPIRKRSPRILR